MLNQRLNAVIGGSVAAMLRAARRFAEAWLDPATRARLTALMTTWSQGGNMDRAEFAGQFFGRAGDDRVAMGLRDAALTARLSGDPAALRDAAKSLADAMQTVTLERWSRFLTDAEARAREPSTRAALTKSQSPVGLERDAIKPVYPVETAVGIAAAGVAGGTAAVARTAGGAVLRQLLPGKSPNVATKPLDVAPAIRSEPTLDIVAPGGKPVGSVVGRANMAIRTVTRSEFQNIKGRLMQGATHVEKPRYIGTWYRRPDGSEFGVRISTQNGETIDVSHSNLPQAFRIHQQ